MLLAVLIIIDSDKQHFVVALKRIRILLILYLSNSRIRSLVPFKLDDHRRIGICIYKWFWNKYNICKTLPCRKLLNDIVLLPCVIVCNKHDKAQGLLIVIVQDRTVLLMLFLQGIVSGKKQRRIYILFCV